MKIFIKLCVLLSPGPIIDRLEWLFTVADAQICLHILIGYLECRQIKAQTTYSSIFVIVFPGYALYMYSDLEAEISPSILIYQS